MAVSTAAARTQWSELIAGAVAWLDKDHRNPVALIEERKKQDHQAGSERAILEALVERYGNRP